MRPNRKFYLFWFFLLISLLLFNSGCGNNNRNDSANETIPAAPTFQNGSTTIVVQDTINNAGGSIEVGDEGSPIDGIKVEFPLYALSEDVEVSLGYNDGTLNPNYGTFSGKTIVLNVPDANIFNKPVRRHFSCAILRRP